MTKFEKVFLSISALFMVFLLGMATASNIESTRIECSADGVSVSPWFSMDQWIALQTTGVLHIGGPNAVVVRKDACVIK